MESDETLAAGTIPSLLALDEGSTLEFKSSLRWDYRDNAVNKSLTRAVIKTLAGFLNTDGGTLLIGVSNDGNVLGLDPDLATLSEHTTDRFELTIRTALAEHLGPSIGPTVSIRFERVTGQAVACVVCPAHSSPVFFREGASSEFFVRDGNLTRPLELQAAIDYISRKWPSGSSLSTDDIREIAAQLRAQLSVGVTPTPSERAPQTPPPWLRVATRRVIDAYLRPLAQSHGWRRLYLVSPWISEIGAPASITFAQLLRRLIDDQATAYVVTRPPKEDWHQRAVDLLGASGRANIVTVDGLHTKLFTAMTDVGSFALLGSANLTQNSLANREVGVLVTAKFGGRPIVRDLDYEAAEIYRSPGRKLVYRARF